MLKNNGKSMQNVINKFFLYHMNSFVTQFSHLFWFYRHSCFRTQFRLILFIWFSFQIFYIYEFFFSLISCLFHFDLESFALRCFFIILTVVARLTWLDRLFIVVGLIKACIYKFVLMRINALHLSWYILLAFFITDFYFLFFKY